MNGTIYKIQNNINNKIYIGLTTRNVNIRWEEHKKAALSDAEEFENVHLYNGMRKYGLNNFSFSIIETNIIDFNILVFLSATLRSNKSFLDKRPQPLYFLFNI